MMRTTKTILIALVVFNVALAGTVPAKACTMPCCAHPKKDACKDGAPVGVSAAKGACCDVKSGGSMPDAAFVSAVSIDGPDIQYNAPTSAYANIFATTSPERLRPGPLLKSSSPPVYTLTSSYLC